VIVRATEAYTRDLPGHRRSLVPLHSLQVATEPLPASTWARIGWRGRETLADGRHLIIYAQRTVDGRIAIAAAGAVPLRLAAGGVARGERALFAALEATLVDLFPALAGVPISHRWGGPFGVAARLVPRRSASTGPAGSRGRAATWARASRAPRSRAGRWRS